MVAVAFTLGGLEAGGDALVVGFAGAGLGGVLPPGGGAGGASLVVVVEEGGDD